MLVCRHDNNNNDDALELGAMPAVTSVDLSGDSYIDGLLGDLQWAIKNFTYSFPALGSNYGSSYGEAENVTNFGALNTYQQATVRTALSMGAVTLTRIRRTETNSVS
jgi:serralysin